LTTQFSGQALRSSWKSSGRHRWPTASPYGALTCTASVKSPTRSRAVSCRGRPLNSPRASARSGAPLPVSPPSLECSPIPAKRAGWLALFARSARPPISSSCVLVGKAIRHVLALASRGAPDTPAFPPDRALSIYHSNVLTPMLRRRLERSSGVFVTATIQHVGR